MLVRAVERRQTVNPIHPKDPALAALFRLGDSASGVNVTPETAITFSAVFDAVRILAETLGSVPLVVFERAARGKDRVLRHPLYPILHHRANPEMTSAEFRETLMGHIGLRGNGLAEIIRTIGGSVLELWPLRPDRVRAVRRNGELWYLVDVPLKPGEPQAGFETRALSRSQVLHVRGLSSDGIWGYSPVALARESIALGIAQERFGARFFRNDARPGGVLQAAGQLSDSAHARLKTDWAAIHEGLENAHRVAILEEGMTWQQVGVKPEEAQFLESRKFQVTEIARWYRIPPHMLADLDRATFSNIEQQSLEFIQYTMLPWFVKWEQAILRDLLSVRESERFFAEFQIQGLIRGDMATRFQSYVQAVQNGWMSANEVRDLENLNPREGGDEFYVPLNLIPASAAADPIGSRGAPVDGSASERRALMRAKRSAEGRRRLASRFEGPFSALALRVIRSERREVLRAAEKLLGQRDVQDFSVWLDAFYGDHQAFVEREAGPLFLSFAESARIAAAGEVDIDPGDDPGFATFAAALAAAYAIRHVESSRAQLQVAATENSDDPLKALGVKFDDWEENRSKRIAKRETVQTSNATAKRVFMRAGFTRLVWVTFGENCPFCDALEGKTVGIEENFVGAGETFEAEGQQPLRIRRPVGHAPLHGGCDCQIVPT